MEEEELAQTFDSNASACSSTNEVNSDWNEKKRKYFKKAKVHGLQEVCKDREVQRPLCP